MLVVSDVKGVKPNKSHKILDPGASKHNEIYTLYNTDGVTYTLIKNIGGEILWKYSLYSAFVARVSPICSENNRGALKEVDEGSVEAAKSMGATNFEQYSRF